MVHGAVPLCAAAAEALDKRSSKALALFCLGEVAASACVPRGRSKKPNAAVAFLVVSEDGGGCRRGRQARRRDWLARPGFECKSKEQSRAGTCITSACRETRPLYSFVALLLAEAAKAISKPMEAAVEATSALFIWGPFARIRAAPASSCNNTVANCLWKPKLSLFSPPLTAQVGASKAKNFGSYSSVSLREMERREENRF